MHPDTYHQTSDAVLNKRDIPEVQRGVLDPRAGATRFVESVRPPAIDLADLVKQYWSASWDLHDRDPYTIQLLPAPGINVVVSADTSWIQGVVRARFQYRMEGRGSLFGIAFRPAGFRPFMGATVSRLTDRTAAVNEVFGANGDTLVAALQGQPDDAGRVDVAESFLCSRLPMPDSNIPMINAIVDHIMTDRTTTRVGDLAAAAGMGQRTLQRLFEEYVGVNPKWVIQRYRLQEAAALLDSGADVDLAGLAAELGYADQAHFARDFKSVVGRSPSQYARSVPA
jgi:AraC-like DNA-binding protein